MCAWRHYPYIRAHSVTTASEFEVVASVDEVSDICTHQHFSMSQGELLPDGTEG